MEEIISKYIRKRLRIEGNRVYDYSHTLYWDIKEIFSLERFSVINWIIENVGEIYITISSEGFQCWHKGDDVHRDGDLPAKIWADGAKEWWVDGRIHRVGDKPAATNLNGYMAWYKGGRRHRLNGPARISHNGQKTWYEHGVIVNPKDIY